MAKSWEEKYVDRQIDEAWLQLRIQLADLLVAAMAQRETEPVEFAAPNGEKVVVSLNGDEVVVDDGVRPRRFANVDEAAFEVFEILHDQWQVVHPVFVASDFCEPAPVTETPPVAALVVPVLGNAESRGQLQAWVEATFQEELSEPLKVAPNQDIHWRGRGGVQAIVSVRSDRQIQIWTQLARDVSFSRTNRVMGELSRKYGGVKFFLLQDRLIMSQAIDARPFVADHAKAALGRQLALADELGWVQEKVLRRRPRQAAAPVLAGPDPELVALLPTANRLGSAALIEVVTQAASSPATLRTWRGTACKEWTAARQLQRDQDSYGVSRRLRTGWMRLFRAIDQALKIAEGTGKAA